MRLCDECNLDRADVLAQFKLGKSSVVLVRIALACAQQNEELMQVEHQRTWSKMCGVGDVIEAVGGICHAWRREASILQACLADRSGVPVEEFKQVGEVLRQLARSCRWFPRDAWGRAEPAEWRKDHALEPVVCELQTSHDSSAR